MLASLRKWLGLIGVTILSLGLAGCAHSQKGRGDMPTKPIEEVLKEHTPALMAIPGVVGTAQSLCDGKDCIKVYVVEMTSQLKKKIPEALEGYPVDVEVTGEFRALPKKKQGP